MSRGHVRYYHWEIRGPRGQWAKSADTWFSREQAEDDLRDFLSALEKERGEEVKILCEEISLLDYAKHGR